MDRKFIMLILVGVICSFTIHAQTMQVSSEEATTVAVSYLKRAVCIYHTESREQSNQILTYQIKYSISQYKKQQYSPK